MKAIVTKVYPLRMENIEGVEYFVVDIETDLIKGDKKIMFQSDTLYFTNKEDANKIIVGYEFEVEE